MSKLHFLKADLITIESFLMVHPLGSLQRSDRVIEIVNCFSAIHCPGDRKLEGFIWKPKQKDIQYEIDLNPVIPTIEIILGSGNFDADVEKVKTEIPFLRDTSGIRRAAMGKPGGGGKGKKGYYLEVGTAKSQALANFEDAVRNEIGSDEFVEFCVPRHFKMKYYK